MARPPALRRRRTALAAIAAVMSVSALAGCGSDESSDRSSKNDASESPSDRLRAAYSALEDNDCDEYASFAVDDERRTALAECEAAIAANGRFEDIDLEIIDSSTDGDTAQIEAHLRYTQADGDDDETTTVVMLRVDGEWYIAGEDASGGSGGGAQTDGAVSNLPDGYDADPAWHDSRELLGSTADVVVVTDETAVVGLDAETGDEAWTQPTTAPDDLPGAEFKGAHFMGRSVALVWSGTQDSDSLEKADEVAVITFIDSTSGNEVATETISDSSGSVESLGFNGIVAYHGDSGSGNRTAFSANGVGHQVNLTYDVALQAVHDTGIVTGRSSGSENGLDRISPKVPGRFAANRPIVFTGDRAVRRLYEPTEPGSLSKSRTDVFYQLVNPATAASISSPTVCVHEGGDALPVVSPGRGFAASEQAVVNLSTGAVRCLDALSSSLAIEVTVLGDDGSLYGIAGDRPFYLGPDANAAPDELAEGDVVPIALLGEVDLFEAPTGGVTAYARN